MNNKVKEIRTKVANILGYIYGIGIFIALFAGALSFLGYFVAIIIGGQTATDICVFIYKSIYPILFTFTSCIVLLGLVKMYVAGEKSLAPKKKDKKKKEEKATESVEITEQNANDQIASDTDDQPTES